jgi:predicted transcriptional regulator
MPQELDAIADQLSAGGVVAPVTVREFLGWFGAQRRGVNVVWDIRQQLEKAGVETVPDFESLWIEAPVEFRRVEVVSEDDGNGDAELALDRPLAEPGGIYLEEATSAWLIRDPTYRISKLAAANTAVERVAPDEPISLAVTKMLSRDFSQLPVMTSDREVKGLISWRSIGSRLALGIAPKLVRDAMDQAQEVQADESIFDAIPWIVKYDYVLVRADNKVITGIVTASDLSLQFETLTEPFLVLSEVENLVRNMIGDKFTPSELGEVRDAGDQERLVESVADLTFGEYVRLLENPDRWERLNLRIDRNLFCQDLNKVRIIRNEVMHFDPDGIEPEDLVRLRNFAQFLKRLEKLRR